jgi:hypothetical protein
VGKAADLSLRLVLRMGFSELTFLLNQTFADVEKNANYLLSLVIYGMGLRHRVKFALKISKTVFFRKYAQTDHELVAYEFVLLTEYCRPYL